MSGHRQAHIAGCGPIEVVVMLLDGPHAACLLTRVDLQGVVLPDALRTAPQSPPGVWLPFLTIVIYLVLIRV